MSAKESISPSQMTSYQYAEVSACRVIRHTTNPKGMLNLKEVLYNVWQEKGGDGRKKLGNNLIYFIFEVLKYL